MNLFCSCVCVDGHGISAIQHISNILRPACVKDVSVQRLCVKHPHRAKLESRGHTGTQLTPGRQPMTGSNSRPLGYKYTAGGGGHSQLWVEVRLSDAGVECIWKVEPASCIIPTRQRTTTSFSCSGEKVHLTGWSHSELELVFCDAPNSSFYFS